MRVWVGCVSTGIECKVERKCGEDRIVLEACSSGEREWGVCVRGESVGRVCELGECVGVFV